MCLVVQYRSVLDCTGPVLDCTGPVQDCTGPVLDCTGCGLIKRSKRGRGGGAEEK